MEEDIFLFIALSSSSHQCAYAQRKVTKDVVNVQSMPQIARMRLDGRLFAYHGKFGS
jgi:hypothetical protein